MRHACPRHGDAGLSEVRFYPGLQPADEKM